MEHGGSRPVTVDTTAPRPTAAVVVSPAQHPGNDAADMEAEAEPVHLVELSPAAPAAAEQRASAADYSKISPRPALHLVRHTGITYTRSHFAARHEPTIVACIWKVHVLQACRFVVPADAQQYARKLTDFSRLQVNDQEFENDLVCFLEAIGEDRLAKNVRGRHIGW